MLHATKGIVLRTIKYGETSIVVNIYTELFGIQSYLVNGVRTEKKSSTKANIYQPTKLLDLIVYHTAHKNLQRIKEAKLWSINNAIHISVIKNTIAIYIVELIQKAISEPETNEDLFSFFSESFAHIYNTKEKELANFPIQFTREFATHLGFGMQNNFSEKNTFFDLQNGRYVTEESSFTLNKNYSKLLFKISMNDCADINILSHERLYILQTCIKYLQFHIPHLSELKSVQILHDILH